MNDDTLIEICKEFKRQNAKINKINELKLFASIAYKMGQQNPVNQQQVLK